MPLLRFLQKNEMFRNVGALASGVFLAQIITLATTPLLTRLYGPQSFAVLALFMAFIGAISPGICGRYEIAQVVVKSRRERNLLFALTIWISWIVSLALFVFLLLFREAVTSYFNAELLGATVLFFPVGLALFATVLSLRFYANSEKRYGVIAQMSVIQALFVALAAVIFALNGEQGIWLIYATALGYLVGVLYLVVKMQRPLAQVRFFPTRRHWWIAKKYRQFPIYNATSSILDGVTLSMPVFFLMRDYPGEVVGFYSLLLKVATAPIGFISSAVAQVYLRQIAEMTHRGEPMLGYLLRTTALLGGIMLFPSLIFMVAAPQLFAWGFGTEWREAGILLQILMPALAIKFVVSTLSGVFSSTGYNKLGAGWKIGAFITTFGAFYLYSGNLDVPSFFTLMVVIDLCLYTIHYALIVYAIRFPRKLI